MRMRDIIKRYTSEYRNGNKSQKTNILKLIQSELLTPCGLNHPKPTFVVGVSLLPRASPTAAAKL